MWIDVFIKPVLLMMVFVRAEREADWPLHLWAVAKMNSYFFAAGHCNYARYDFCLLDWTRYIVYLLFNQHLLEHQTPKGQTYILLNQ